MAKLLGELILAVKKNFDDYFGSSDENLKFDENFKRYGFKTKSEYGWEKI